MVVDIEFLWETLFVADHPIIGILPMSSHGRIKIVVVADRIPVGNRIPLKVTCQEAFWIIEGRRWQFHSPSHDSNDRAKQCIGELISISYYISGRRKVISLRKVTSSLELGFVQWATGLGGEGYEFFGPQSHWLPWDTLHVRTRGRRLRLLGVS